MSEPFVSVVITTKNEEAHIGHCLASVVGQSYPRASLEIIVVDNHSTDTTVAIARQYTDRVFEKGPERSAQRNFGVRESAGIWFLYLDADMTLSEDVIRACVKRAQKGDVVGLYISEVITGSGFWSAVRRFERSFYTGTVIDCVRFVKREAFDRVDGFDEMMSGPEDWDFDKKIRGIGRVDVIDNSLYHNEAAFHLQRYLAKKRYYTKSFGRYVEKWGARDRDVRKQLGFSYRFVGVFLEAGKWKRILAHPILTAGMYTLRFLVGVGYLLNRSRYV